MADMEKDKVMSDEEDKVMPDEEDKGVKIEIHGEDEPAEEEKAESVVKEDPKADKTSEEDQAEQSAEEAVPDDPGSDEAGSGPEADEAEDGKDDKADSGKGFFFRKDKKDKKDEKIAELTDKVQRQMAEFDNFRKRTEREKAGMFDLGKKDVIEKILPVVDNFERGLGDMKEDESDPFRQGMMKIYKQLTTALEGLGVRPIEAEGKEFDPGFHNAVMHCEDDSVGENIVVQEFQKGYMLNDTVIRHSMVKVAN